MKTIVLRLITIFVVAALLVFVASYREKHSAMHVKIEYDKYGRVANVYGYYVMCGGREVLHGDSYKIKYQRSITSWRVEVKESMYRDGRETESAITSVPVYGWPPEFQEILQENWEACKKEKQEAEGNKGTVK
jgi:hypothetical protein